MTPTAILRAFHHLRRKTGMISDLAEPLPFSGVPWIEELRGRADDLNARQHPF
jgi:hypothetical protein